VKKLSIGPEGTGAVVDEDAVADLGGSQVAVVDETADDAPKKAVLPARAVLNDDGTVTLALVRKVPLTIRSGGKERHEVYSELVFHELSGLDLRLIAQTGEAMQTVTTLARATRMPVVRMNILFDHLSSRDVKAASEIITFLSE
jgi:hypothetical protein